MNGVGGIRTLVPAEPANAFRVRLVMTTSIRLRSITKYTILYKAAQTDFFL